MAPAGSCPLRDSATPPKCTPRWTASSRTTHRILRAHSLLLHLCPPSAQEHCYTCQVWPWQWCGLLKLQTFSSAACKNGIISPSHFPIQWFCWCFSCSVPCILPYSVPPPPRPALLLFSLLSLWSGIPPLYSTGGSFLPKITLLHLLPFMIWPLFSL